MLPKFNINILDIMKTQDLHDTPHSSAQLFCLLDNLIYAGLHRILESTTFVDRVLSSVIAWYHDNKRRRLSKLDRVDTISALISVIRSDNTEIKSLILQDICIERSVLFLSLSTFLTITDEYLDLQNKLVVEADIVAKNKLLQKCKVIETKVGLKPDHDLYSVVRDVRLWNKTAQELKEKIMQKYYRYIFSLVIKEQKRSTIPVDIEDLAHNYLIGLSKTINKYMMDKGTFKSYLDRWLLEAKSDPNNVHYYGTAFTAPPKMVNKGRVNNIAVAYTPELANQVDGGQEQTFEERIIRELEIERVAVLAKYADPNGYGRESLGLS